MTKIKNIAFFTSIRSEYGLLSPLIKAVDANDEYNLKLLVGGAHLLEEYGSTINQIITDGFTIAEKFDFLDSDSSKDFSTRSLGKLQQQIGEYLYLNPPDLLFILGDRYELIPVATAALLNNIPIAHISGGETTEGAIDNQIRHSLTKMAHLHFPATETYKSNILKMGEESWRVCASGEPGLDEVLNMQYIEKSDLYYDLGLDLNKKTICCTFHPQTIDNRIDACFVEKVLLEIIKDFNFQILVTASNFDNGGKNINDCLEKLSKENDRIVFVKNLGQKRYYSFLKYIDLMIGNSSSGLVEAQSFDLPVVNIGDRQKGRLSNNNVLNCAIEIEEVLSAVKYSLTNEFKNSFKGSQNIYGDGKSCDRIMLFLKELPDVNLFIKKDVF